MSTSQTNTETLEQALMRCYGNASKTLYSQAQRALYAVKRYSKAYDPSQPSYPSRYEGMSAKDITQSGIESATAAWYKDGLSPATINKRLNCLSKMGVSVEGLRVKNPKKSKWHLTEGQKDQVVAWLRQQSGEVYKAVADFIVWTTVTGLRIEESLRLRWDDIEYRDIGNQIWVMDAVKVPGTKTVTSEATLPLGEQATACLHRRGNVLMGGEVFKLTYETVLEIWNEVREQFGFDADTATLKALRRSAARYLHVDCGMPLHMVQQYLRHESMDTTLEYLRLTGGYGTEEMRRYLK